MFSHLRPIDMFVYAGRKPGILVVCKNSKLLLPQAASTGRNTKGTAQHVADSQKMLLLWKSLEQDRSISHRRLIWTLRGNSAVPTLWTQSQPIGCRIAQHSRSGMPVAPIGDNGPMSSPSQLSLQLLVRERWLLKENLSDTNLLFLLTKIMHLRCPRIF